MKKAENEIEFYSNNKMKGVPKEAQEEIVRIINSWKVAVENEFDIITNGSLAKCFQPQLTLKGIKDGSYLGGFNAGFTSI